MWLAQIDQACFRIFRMPIPVDIRMPIPVDIGMPIPVEVRPDIPQCVESSFRVQGYSVEQKRVYYKDCYLEDVP